MVDNNERSTVIVSSYDKRKSGGARVRRSGEVEERVRWEKGEKIENKRFSIVVSRHYSTMDFGKERTNTLQ
jgi:hypothetical protein